MMPLQLIIIIIGTIDAVFTTTITIISVVKRLNSVDTTIDAWVLGWIVNHWILVVGLLALSIYHQFRHPPASPNPLLIGLEQRLDSWYVGLWFISTMAAVIFGSIIYPSADIELSPIVGLFKVIYWYSVVWFLLGLIVACFFRLLRKPEQISDSRSEP